MPRRPTAARSCEPTRRKAYRQVVAIYEKCPNHPGECLVAGCTICLKCSSRFHQNYVGRPAIFCSQVCRQAAYADERRAERLASRSRPVHWLNV